MDPDTSNMDLDPDPGNCLNPDPIPDPVPDPDPSKILKILHVNFKLKFILVKFQA